MGQTLRGDLEGGEEVWLGGSLGPVGSPGLRRRESDADVVVKERVVGRRTRVLRRIVRVGIGMMRFLGYDGGGTAGYARWVD